MVLVNAGLCLFKHNTYGLGDEPGENTAFKGNLKIIIFFPWSKMSPIYTLANIYLEKCKMTLNYVKTELFLLLGIQDTFIKQFMTSWLKVMLSLSLLQEFSWWPIQYFSFTILIVTLTFERADCLPFQYREQNQRKDFL